MSTNQTSFQDRLKKIEKKQASAPGTGPAAPASAAGGKPPPEFGAGPKRESAIGTGHLMIAGAVVGILALGAVLVRDVLAPPEDLTAEVMAGGESRDVSLLGRLLGGSFDPQSVQARLPVYHLPQAPEGYIRATLSDARKMNAMAQFRDQWPEGSGSGYVTFEQNPGHGALSKFVAVNQIKPDPEEAKVRAVAHYLSTSGSYLFMTMQFVPGDQRFGADNAPGEWAEHLLKTGAAFNSGQPRVAEFGDQILVARGRVSLDPESTTPANVDLVVPLTPQAILRISGTAPPSEIAGILDSVNIPALQAFAS